MACCICSQTRPGPRQRGPVGKVADRPAAGRRKRIPGLARSFSIALCAPGAALLSKVWFPCRARSAGDRVSVRLVFKGGVGQERSRYETRWAHHGTDHFLQADFPLLIAESFILTRVACHSSTILRSRAIAPSQFAEAFSRNAFACSSRCNSREYSTSRPCFS